VGRGDRKRGNKGKGDSKAYSYTERRKEIKLIRGGENKGKIKRIWKKGVRRGVKALKTHNQQKQGGEKGENDEARAAAQIRRLQRVMRKEVYVNCRYRKRGRAMKAL